MFLKNDEWNVFHIQFLRLMFVIQFHFHITILFIDMAGLYGLILVMV